jgi:hypothetical protein
MSKAAKIALFLLIIIALPIYALQNMPKADFQHLMCLFLLLFMMAFLLRL